MKNEKNLILTEKHIKIKKINRKVNTIKNLQIMNLPEFHFNRTIKEYINSKLSKNINPINKQKLPENSQNIKSKCLKNFIRINTASNIHKTKKYFSKKKIEKKTKNSPTPKPLKKMFKSISRPKLNISNYVMKSKKKKINKQRNVDPLFSDNSTHKYSTTLSNTGTNQLADKTISIYNQNNKIVADNSTIDLHKNKNYNNYGQTTSKKMKFSYKYFSDNNKVHIKFAKLNKFKDKNKDNVNPRINININNINNKYNLDNSFRKSFIDNENYNNNINKTENNIAYNNSDINYNNENNNGIISITKFDNNIKSIKSQNENYTPKKLNQKNISLVDNNYKSPDENIMNINNNNAYIKKIEMLENENKILKNEINYSRNKLQLLEDKINLLLTGKNIIMNEKEECPQPTPYVIKYSSEIFYNNNNKEMNNKVKNKNF